MSILRPSRFHTISNMIAAILCVSFLFAAGTVHALTAFDSLNGNFTFSNFHITVPSSILISDISFESSEGGFDILIHNGAMTVTAGELRDIVVQYDVTAHSEPIAMAFLSFSAATLGSGAIATVSEDYFAEPGGEHLPPGLTVWSTDLDKSLFASQQVGARNILNVKKDILVSGGMLDGFAAITKVSQRFEIAPIPEPSASLIFAAGMGMVAIRLRRIGARALEPMARR